jgi:hypothetical protein
VGVALIIVAVIATMFLGKDNSVKVTLDDVDDPKTRKRAKIKKPDGAPSGSAAAVTT